VVGFCCNGPFAGCFCTSAGGGLAEKEGSDLFVTELDNGYFVEAIPEKGKKLLGRPRGEDGATFADAAAKKQEQASKALQKVIPGDPEPRISREAFESDTFWDEVSAKCLSCGVCTYLCPTCYCFNITDEARLEGGERVRSWDACMFHHFTLEASGHNPRNRKAMRLKQRVGHKFLYYVDKYGTIACSGCGRCIRHCPVSVEISHIVARLTEGAQGDQKAAEARS
jgi:ferredoxin